MTTATANALTTTAEKRRRTLAEQSQGLLQEEWLHGSLWNLSMVGDPSVTVAITSGTRPYKVTWQTSGDRKVNGEYKAVDFSRSRSFGKVESMLNFLKWLTD